MEKRQCRLLTLDVWDTVIRRRCHPDEIKIKTAEEFLRKYGSQCRQKKSAADAAQMRIACERRIGASCRKNGWDDEYELHDVLKMWTGSLLKADTHVQMDHIVSELYWFELEKELENSYLDPEITQLIDSIEYERLAFISDFYAGKDFILQILSHCGFTHKADAVYISCECRYNKRSGRLFDYVRGIEKAVPEQWIHIGDNGFSDVEVPKKKGIAVLHYMPEKETRLRRYREKRFSWDGAGKKRWKGSRHISEFFWGFTAWLAEEAAGRGIRHLYFFTREGEFYKELYDEMKAHHLYGSALPDAQVVEVSRVSTFMPSLREITLSEFMRIWNQYSIQSMEALFQSLHMNLSEVKADLDKHRIPQEEVIRYPWQDQRVQELFADADFIEKMEAERNRKRSMIYEYLASRGWKQDDMDAVGIVDIGWRGTIQDNLCYLYPSYKIHGFYIGLIPFLSPQPANGYKYGYLNQYKFCRALFFTVTPFEMLCNSPNGSVVGYEKKAGGVCAVRKREADEDAVYYQAVKAEQEEIKKRIPDYCRKAEETGCVQDDYRDCAYQALHHFIFYPRRKIVEAYFRLKHNEEFGVGEYVDKTTRFRPGLLLRAAFSAKRRKELMEFLRDTAWAQGYLVKYRLYPALWVYNRLLIKHMDCK